MTEPVARWAEHAAHLNAAVRAADRWRAPRDLIGDSVHAELTDGRAVVAFATNDYLGLSQHPAVVAAAHAELDRSGAGSGSARLIVGARPVHSRLEHALADWKHEQAATLFATGFAANLGALTTFGGPDVLICSDELNHASIIDGCRLSRSRLAVYPHADLAALDACLATAPEGRAIVVTDTVFSMDGDVADISGLVDVCERHDALLVLDEAHAVLGPDPDPADLRRVAHLRVGTLSKTLGSLGGFVAGTRDFADLLVNRARSYIFTTASTPADAAAALAALQVLRSAEGTELVTRLRANVDRVRVGHPSPIVPIVCGDEQRALDASSALLDRGLLVPAIRPPTVAPGSSRLRITLSATHTDAEITRLLDVLDDLGLR